MKILFITHTRIGDAVLSSGILHSLVMKYPEARFTVACGPLAASLFAAVPRLDRVIVIAKRRFDAHWFTLWRDLRRTSWDLVVDLRRSLVSYFIRARQRRVLGPADDHVHRVRYLASVLELNEPAPPHLYASPQAATAAARRVPDGPPVLALAPVAAQPHKTWPAERFAELARRLAAGRCSGWRFAVLGAEADAPAAAGLIAKLPPDRRITLFDEPDLLVVYAALGRCQAFIGNDSGLSHLAAAAGLPTLALFGSSDPVRYAPWGAQSAVVRAPEPGRRMADLSVAAVEEAFNKLPLAG